MAQQGLYFNQTRCTGCYTCVVACKDWYDIDAGSDALIRVRRIEKGCFPHLFAAYLAMPCYHCESAPCLKACPEKAITKRDEDGIVVVDRYKCTGRDVCGEKCLKACPWDAPRFSAESNAKMMKCDLCLNHTRDGRKPVCVEACPMFALDIGPLDELRKKYGDISQAEGFIHKNRFKPSVTFKPKIFGTTSHNVYRTNT